jgi:MFS family permease
VRRGPVVGSGVVRELLREQWFPKLYATRLLSQLADGVFQASLASAVFFNPDHRTDPKQAAAGFVVLLLPYSLVGPFAGVFLDRWLRQRVLVRANFLRCLFILATALVLVMNGPRGGLFYVAALAALSVNRFYLAALSAALPHVVSRKQLLVANSLSTTSGSFVTILGLGIALTLRKAVGDTDGGNAIVAVSSCALYLAASASALRMPPALLGPASAAAPLAQAIRDVARGLAGGAAHVWSRRPAARALGAIAASRFLFGIATIGSLLLYRNYFHNHGLLRAGLAGLSQALAASAAGYVLAAFVTPVATDRIGKPRWVVLVFTAASVAQVVFGLPFAMAPLLAGAFVVGFATQSVKICVDTIVQEEIDDDFRGRVFSFYDTVFNLTFVFAAVMGAFVLPKDGKSYPVLIGIAAGYALTALLYGAAERRGGPGRVSARSAAEAR